MQLLRIKFLGLTHIAGIHRQGVSLDHTKVVIGGVHTRHQLLNLGTHPWRQLTNQVVLLGLRRNIDRLSYQAICADKGRFGTLPTNLL